MKKLIILISALAFVFVSPTFADQGGEGNNTHCNGVGNANSPCGGNGDGNGNGDGDGETVIGFGGFKIKAKALGGGYDADNVFITRGSCEPSGEAGGESSAAGGSKAKAAGFVFNGLVESDIDVIGGGLTQTNSYIFHSGIGDKNIGVRSESTSYGITSVRVRTKVDPGFGFGKVKAKAKGFAYENTSSYSGVGSSPLNGWESEGESEGSARQGAEGGWHGSAYAESGPDYFSFRSWSWRDSKAGAGFGAGIEMTGGSMSESYRYMADDGNAHTEGMGTRVGAYTDVNSYGYDYDWDRGLSRSGAHVSGGYVAGGHVNTITSQEAGNGRGGAGATAIGCYKGAGRLGSNYTGSANGYSHTSTTTFNGMNGSVNSASAGMSVYSGNSNDGGDPQ